MGMNRKWNMKVFELHELEEVQQPDTIQNINLILVDGTAGNIPLGDLITIYSFDNENNKIKLYEASSKADGTVDWEAVDGYAGFPVGKYGFELQSSPNGTFINRCVLVDIETENQEVTYVGLQSPTLSIYDGETKVTPTDYVLTQSIITPLGDVCTRDFYFNENNDAMIDSSCHFLVEGEYSYNISARKKSGGPDLVKQGAFTLTTENRTFTVTLEPKT